MRKILIVGIIAIALLGMTGIVSAANFFEFTANNLGGTGSYANPILHLSVQSDGSSDPGQTDTFTVAGANDLSGTYNTAFCMSGGLSTSINMGATIGADFEHTSTMTNDETNGPQTGSYTSEDAFMFVRTGGDSDVKMQFGSAVTNRGYSFGKGGSGGHHLSLKGQVVEYGLEVGDHEYTTPYAQSYMGISTDGLAQVENSYYALGGIDLREDSPATTGRLNAGSRWTATGDGTFTQTATGTNYLNFNGAVGAGSATYTHTFTGGFSFKHPTDPKEPGPSVDAY